MVKFLSDANAGGNLVSVPLPSDGEDSWVIAANAIYGILKNDESVAFCTEGLVDAARATKIEEDAQKRMTKLQADAYEEWRAGNLKPPAWDFPSHVSPIPADSKSLGDWNSKSAALCRIYGVENISAEQAKAWVLANFKSHVLLKAVVILVRSERCVCGGMVGIDPKLFMEKVAVKKLLRHLKMHTYKKTYVKGKPTDIFKTLEDGLIKRFDELETSLKM